MYNLRLLQFHSRVQLRAELDKMGVESGLLPDHLEKGALRALKLERVPPLLARFVYQELVLEGGDVVLPPRLDDQKPNAVDVLLLGTIYQLRHLAVRIRSQSDSELNTLADELERALKAADGIRRSLTIRSTTFQWGSRTYVMGIVNATPDSFSGDGILARGAGDHVDRAVAHAEQLVSEGADIIDVGGESTRPGSQPTPPDEEFQRVVPVISKLRPKISVPISVDTYKASVARGALDAGADLVNDVWGLRMDADMRHVVAERGAPVVIMHNRSKPKDAVQTERLGGRYVGVEYGDLLGDVIRELREQVELGLEAGVQLENVIVDPGIGFGKTVEQNIELVNRVGELRVLGCPILLGPSRKGFIGYTLDLPPDQRTEGTAAAVAIGIARGVDIVRVHDVQAMARVARMTDALVRAKEEH